MTTLSEAMGGTKAVVRKYAPKSLMWRVAPIRLYWAGSNDENANFGDQLSPLLIRNLFGASVKYSGIGAADMVAVGSILEGAQNLAETRPWIWGSGFIEPGGPWNGSDVTVLALRGALSMERFVQAGYPEVPLGDPGILVRQALSHLQRQPSDRIGFVPHFTERDNERSREIASHPSVKLINVCAPVEDVVSEILQCRLVLSSSLHGLIVSDSFGVPNQWIEPGPGVTGGRYKFDDYYSAFGVKRGPVDPVEMIREADHVVSSWRPLPHQAAIEAGLMKAFPIHRRRVG